MNRDIFSRTILASCALVAVGSAHALGNSSNANNTPVVSPINGQATDVWKLAGMVTPNQIDKPSAVQIAPSWIMTAHHVVANNVRYTQDTVSLGNWSFQNQFGTSTFTSCYLPTYDNTHLAAPPDVALCKLATPINPPAGFVFPPLVQNPTTLAGTAPVNMISPSLGAFLAVGYGLPNPGTPQFAWVDYLGIPYGDAYTPSAQGIYGPVPNQQGNDSGSPRFWFHPSTSAIGLVSLAKFSGAVRTEDDAVFETGTLDWINQIAGADVATSSAAAFFGTMTMSPPWLDKNSLQINGSIPSAIDIGWKTPSSYGNLVKRYFITLDKNGANYISQFVQAGTSGSQSLQLTALETGPQYTLCVVPSGLGIAALGEAPALQSTADFSRNCQQFYMSPQPSVVQSLTIAPAANALKPSLPSFKASWTKPTIPTDVKYLASYQLDITINGVLTTDYVTPTTISVNGDALNIQHGDQICLAVTAIGQPATSGLGKAPVCTTIP